MPIAARLLGRYDAWDHRDPRVLPFQYYMRSIPNTVPENGPLWNWVFSLQDTELEECVRKGDLFICYQNVRDEKAIQIYGFETRMFGYKTLACNSLPGGSQLFTAHPDAGSFDLFVMFNWRDKVGWTISLYTENKTIDCGAIARTMGGGGHRSAAGYVVSILPEELQQHY
jgi:hypothetical protein